MRVIEAARLKSILPSSRGPCWQPRIFFWNTVYPSALEVLPALASGFISSLAIYVHSNFWACAPTTTSVGSMAPWNCCCLIFRCISVWLCWAPRSGGNQWGSQYVPLWPSCPLSLGSQWVVLVPRRSPSVVANSWNAFICGWDGLLHFSVHVCRPPFQCCLLRWHSNQLPTFERVHTIIVVGHFCLHYSPAALRIVQRPTKEYLRWWLNGTERGSYKSPLAIIWRSQLLLSWMSSHRVGVSLCTSNQQICLRGEGGKSQYSRAVQQM